MSNSQSYSKKYSRVAPHHALQAHREGTSQTGAIRKEAIYFSAYFILYIAYLFVYQENEFLHWLSLVIIPAILLYAIQRRSSPLDWSLRNTLATVGILKSNMKNGILLAIVLGLAFGALQLLFSDTKLDIWRQISSGKILFTFPLALFFMMITAGFTEEFFFRGVLQTRFVRATNSRLFGVAAASIMFGLYHLPYAYLNPNWPSYGDLTAALGTAMSETVLVSILIGWLYERTDHNLLACVVMHSLFNTLPAATMLKM